MTRAPLLVLLNGAPAAGKSTLARRYALDHPNTRIIEIDRLRALNRTWHADSAAANAAACDAALRRAGQQLGEGSDVVVPQYFGRAHMVEELEALAHRLGACFVHLILVVEPDETVRRFRHRGVDDPLHALAAELAAESGGEPELRRAGARLAELARSRPGTLLVDSTDETSTYERLLAALATAERGRWG